MTNNKLIIGIAGGTGSGKTTVVNKILKELNSNNVLVISQDNYYRDHPELSFDNPVKKINNPCEKELKSILTTRDQLILNYLQSM